MFESRSYVREPAWVNALATWMLQGEDVTPDSRLGAHLLRNGHHRSRVRRRDFASRTGVRDGGGRSGPRGSPRQPGADLLLAGGSGAALVPRPHKPDALTRHHGISRATAYRYRDEVTMVLAAKAPNLHAALERAVAEGLPHMIPGGKIIPSDRCREKTVSLKGEVVDPLYSGSGPSPRRQYPCAERPGWVPAVVRPP